MTANTANCQRQRNDSVPLRRIEEILGLTVAGARNHIARLTKRERQIAMLVAAGKSNAEIAAELSVTMKTMHIHRAHIRVKLDAYTPARIANVVNLVRLADVAFSTIDA